MFWQVVLGIIVFILILGVIVLVHEGGHFFFAKKAGILCYEFSIGMGPLLWQKKIGETCYSIRLIPIGGFVSMAGEEVELNPLTGYNYCKLTVTDGLVTEIEALKEETEGAFEIVNYDLVGTKEALPGELYIVLKEDENEVRYEIKRDCNVRYTKKQVVQIAPYDRLFVNKKLLQRFLTVFAGPFMNFVLAFVLFFFMGLVTGYADYNSTEVSGMVENTPSYNAGIRDGFEIVYIGDVDNYTVDMNYTKWNQISEALDKLANGEDFNGYVNVIYKDNNGEYKSTLVNPYVFVQSVQVNFVQDGSNSLIVSEYLSKNEDTMSYQAGLRPGDEIISCNGYEFLNRADFLRYFNTGDGSLNNEFVFVVKRANETITLDKIKTYTKQIFNDNNVDVCKVQLYISPNVTRNVGRLIIEPFKEIGTSCTVIFKTLGALFKKNSGLGISDLSGPVGIASATVTIVSQGALSVFNWMAILSVNIGLMNIIPLPALDGGRLAFLGYEAITRKKTNPKIENIIHSIGFILLMALFVFVAFNDVLKIFK